MSESGQPPEYGPPPGYGPLPPGYGPPPGYGQPPRYVALGIDPRDPIVTAEFGSWFQRLFGVIGRSWRSVGLFQLICALPSAALAALLAATSYGVGPVLQHSGSSLTGAVAAMFGAIALSGLALVVVGVAFGLFAQAGSMWIAVREAAGAPAPLAGAFRFGVSRALPLLGWGLLAGLVTAAGFLACILPGFYVAAVFTASLTAVIVFERGQNPIGRSFTLFNKALGPAIGRCLLALLAVIVYTSATSFLQSVLGTALPDPNGITSALLGAFLGLPLAVAGTAFSLVTYAGLVAQGTPVSTSDLLARLPD